MSAEQPKAILFDMDDTILAFDMVSEQCWQSLCGRFAPRIGCEADRLYDTIKEVRAWYQSDKELYRYMRLNLVSYRREYVSMSFERLGISAPSVAVELADSYSTERVEAIYVLPGAVETLKRLKTGNLRLALITNGASLDQRQKLERFGLRPLFDFILIEGEFGAGKPDERVFRHTLEKLGVAPNEALMVGDDLERDIGGAKNVGIFGVWVDWRGTGLPASTAIRPDKIVRTITELK